MKNEALTTISVTERLLEFINKKSDTRNAFYSKTGIGNGALDKKGGMNTNSIEKILEVYPDLNLYWLITGKGMPSINPQNIPKSNDSNDELLDAYKKIVSLQGRLDEANEEVEYLKQECRIKDSTIAQLKIDLARGNKNTG